MAYKSILTQGGDDSGKPKRPYKADVDKTTGRVSINPPAPVSDAEVNAGDRAGKQAMARKDFAATMDDPKRVTTAETEDSMGGGELYQKLQALPADERERLFAKFRQRKNAISGTEADRAPYGQ